MALTHSDTLPISSSKIDLLYNALLVGMAYEDAFLFAGFTEDDIAAAADDEELQHSIAQHTKKLEFQLLGKLNEVVDKQVHMGKETALTWWLEHLNPRYSNKPTGTLPDLHIHLADTDPADLDTVSINNTETDIPAETQDREVVE